MFAFLASMDNYPISIFFTDAWTKTLPIQMLQSSRSARIRDRRDLDGPDPAGGDRADHRRQAGGTASPRRSPPPMPNSAPAR
jgi:hypothetical protein